MCYNVVFLFYRPLKQKIVLKDGVAHLRIIYLKEKKRNYTFVKLMTLFDLEPFTSFNLFH